MPTGRAYATGDVDGDGMPDAAAAAVVKSKSNITNNREESPGNELDPAAMSTNLHSSKSNVYRSASGTGDNDGDASAGGEPEAMASNLNSSKSNIDRSASGDDGGGLPGSAESAMVKSKSNITNNREGETGGGDGGGQGLAIGDQGTNNEEKPRPHH